MPHMLLRHSNNVSNYNFKLFLKNLHVFLVDSLGVKLASCSSLITSHEDYLIGDGALNNAFVHLDIKIKPKYDNNQLELILGAILKLLQKHVENYNKSGLNIRISVDCLELNQYFKN